jgi:dTDP-4-amino-4,6-dideoxygalactose transaminase
MKPRTTHWCYLPVPQLYRLAAGRKRDLGRVSEMLEQFFGRPVVLLNSARTGLYLALAAYGLRPMDEVWVPPFLSQCVLNTVTRVCVPALHRSPRARAMILVHQWGYPQPTEKLLAVARENKLRVIEDCAFSMASTYRGERVGNFGDVAVFSFPKIFQMPMGGCLVTRDARVLEFARQYLRAHGSLAWNAVSALAQGTMTLTLGTRDGRMNSFFRRCNEALYSQYVYFPRPDKRACHLFPATLDDMNRTFEARRQNLARFRRQFAPGAYDPGLEADCDVVPYVVPYFGSPEVMEGVVSALRAIGVETGIYHFDVNRDMAAADYRKCVAVPVHQGIDAGRMEQICQAIATAAGGKMAAAGGG